MITDEQYEVNRKRILKAAEIIANPLIDPDEKQRYLKAYDHLCEQNREFLRITVYGMDYLKKERVR